MKRIALYLGMAAALVASCSTQEKDFQTPIQDDVVFYASFEQPAEEGTRVYANEDLLLRWTADDRVSIFNKITYNQQYVFTGETGDNAGGFRKVDSDEFVTGNTISHVVSVYPYQDATKITESEVLTVTLPAEQSYAENTFGLGANTMVSVSSDNVLQYKNVGGYLMLKLYGEGVSVESITLKGNNGEKLAGKASISMPLDGTPTAVMANDATTEITLVCESSIPLGATVDESTQFWFVIPPMTFEKGFTITVKDSKNGVFEKSTTKSFEISRNKLSKMSVIEVTPEPSDDDAIVFADQKLKERLVVKFDTNGDGELSYKEAAAVTSIEGAVTIKTITSFDEFQYFTGVTSIPNECFKDWIYLKSIILPPTILSIGDSAFYNCNNLSSIILSSELTEIGRLAFYGCSILNDVILPNKLNAIGTNAFVGCESLTKMTIPEGVTRIDGLFVGCSMLETVELPQSLSTIGSSCFTYCANLSSIIIPESVTTIGDYAFDGCYSITSIRIPQNTILIKLGAFRDCRSLEAITVDSQNTVYDSRSNCNAIIETKTNTLIEGCNNSTIPEGITTIGKEAFAGRTKLTSVIIPDSVTTISRSAFRGTGLISISIPESISIIQEMAFDSCSNLVSVILPISISSIGSRAFGYCSGLESIIVYSIAPPTLSGDSFKNTSKFSIFVPAESVEAYKEAENWSNYADQIQPIPSALTPVPEAVDMGLSVMWASFNLGASKPEEYGNYYAWGETQTKSDYSENTYKWFTLTEGVLKVTKYCPSYNRPDWGGAGNNPDNKTVLDQEDDAAHVNLGGNWRMPTRAEMNALIENCAWTWTSLNGVNGMLVTASNGNSIFLPAAGSLFGTDLTDAGDQGHYMNTSLESVDMGGNVSFYDPYAELAGTSRWTGLSIRPVFAL